MAAPLVTQQQVVTALKNLIPKNIVYISFQDDPFNIQVNAFVSDLMSYVVPSTGIQLFDGYHERTFTQDVNYGTQAERHSWVLDLHRLEFQ